MLNWTTYNENALYFATIVVELYLLVRVCRLFSPGAFLLCSPQYKNSFWATVCTKWRKWYYNNISNLYTQLHRSRQRQYWFDISNQYYLCFFTDYTLCSFNYTFWFIRKVRVRQCITCLIIKLENNIILIWFNKCLGFKYDQYKFGSRNI